MPGLPEKKEASCRECNDEGWIRKSRYVELYGAERPYCVPCECLRKRSIESYLSPVTDVLKGVSVSKAAPTSFDADPDVIGQLDLAANLFVTGRSDKRYVYAQIFHRLFADATSRPFGQYLAYSLVKDIEMFDLWFGKSTEETMEERRSWRKAGLMILDLGQISYPNKALAGILNERIVDVATSGVKTWILYFGDDFANSVFASGAVLMQTVESMFREVNLAEADGKKGKLLT